MSKIAGISSRQIQRLENNNSDITLNKLQYFLKKFDLEIMITLKEPDWEVLYNFGLPLNISNAKIKKCKYSTVEKNIILASKFLSRYKSNSIYMRYYDSFKALLLALQIHYPSKFKKIEDQQSIDFTSNFDLKNIPGRHIKLRNICLYNMSRYFS